MSTLFRESALTLSQASRALPGHPHVSTLHRWMRRGVRGVRLDAYRIGGRWYTTREALERFVSATTAAAGTQARVKANEALPLAKTTSDALDALGI